MRSDDGLAETDDLLDLPQVPDRRVAVAEAFRIDVDLEVGAFGRRTAYVPDLDPTYQFDRPTTLAILAGFAHNRRVMIQGYHGTGKSTHIEQVAARLNWPCVRINLDSHISRIDLIGKDAIVLKDGKQVTEYREGILPWALQRPVALVFDEYDAGRPDVMFVIQHGQHRRARRHVRPLPRHAADQSRSDGSLEHRHPAQLFAPRRRVSYRAGKVAILRQCSRP